MYNMDLRLINSEIDAVDIDLKIEERLNIGKFS